MVYQNKGAYDLAIEDYNTAIQLKPDLAEAYHNRGEAWLLSGAGEKAKLDLTKAMGVDIVAEFHSEHESVQNFEERNGLKLPEDIATMLTPPEA